MSVLVPFACLIGLLAFAQGSRIILGWRAGNGQITITAEGINDSRLETGIIFWKDVKTATYFAREQSRELWAELKLANGRKNLHPVRNSLRVRGIPSWRNDRAYVDLKTADQSDVVLGAILKLASQAAHDPLSQRPGPSQ